MAESDLQLDEEWLDDVTIKEEITIYEVPDVKDVKPRGRSTAYAFFVQILREEYKKKHPDRQIHFAEFSRECAEKWRRMSRTEKRGFQEMADKDKVRYEREMRVFRNRGFGSGNCLRVADVRMAKKKKMKDPDAPKKPLSAFFLFANAERSQVKEENPNYSPGETSQKLGRMWGGAEPSVRIKYQELANKERARYWREMRMYELKGESSSVKKARHEEAEEDEEEDDDDDYVN